MMIDLLQNLDNRLYMAVNQGQKNCIFNPPVNGRVENLDLVEEHATCVGSKGHEGSNVHRRCRRAERPGV